MRLRSALWASAWKLHWFNSEGLACFLSRSEVIPNRSLTTAASLTRGVLRNPWNVREEGRPVLAGTAVLRHFHNCREAVGKPWQDIAVITEQQTRALHLGTGAATSTSTEHPRKRSSTLVPASGARNVPGLFAYSENCNQSLPLRNQFRAATTEAKWTEKLRSKWSSFLRGEGNAVEAVVQDDAKADKKEEAAPPVPTPVVAATAAAASAPSDAESRPAAKSGSPGGGFVRELSRADSVDDNRGPSAGPLSHVTNTLLRYREVAALQGEALVRRSWVPLALLTAVGSTVLLSRAMLGTATLFVTLSSETLAYWGFFSLSAAVVTSAAALLHHLYTVNPDAVYRMAMRQLNSSAAALEVMGAPLGGTGARAFIVAGGGGLRFSRLLPKLAAHRCFMVFPLRGSERRGIVSAEVKKKRGKYYFKLLAIDVPTSSALGPSTEQRVYLVGDQAVYNTAGRLISDLRDPLLEVLSRRKEFQMEDDKEDEEEAQLLKEERRLKQEQVAAEEQKRKADEKAREREKRREERAYGL